MCSYIQCHLLVQAYDGSMLHWQYDGILKTDISRKEMEYQTSPFFAECRAYGLLNESKLGSEALDIARSFVAPCHGWLHLLPVHENIIRSLDDKIDLETDNLGGCGPAKSPMHAIVKDFIDSQDKWSEGLASSILRGICALYDMGIFNGDIRAANFVGGKLVDFSTSVTRPHWCLELLLPPSKQESTLCGDFVTFDDMIEDEKIDYNKKAYPGLTAVVGTRKKALNLSKKRYSRKKLLVVPKQKLREASSTTHRGRQTQDSVSRKKSAKTPKKRDK